MKKVVINVCYGGFGLSPEATLELWKRGAGITAYEVHKYFGADRWNSPFGGAASLADWRAYLLDPAAKRDRLSLTVFTPDETQVLSAMDIKRDDEKLVALLEEWGTERVSGAFAQLKVVEIPDGVEFEIEEYDGMEHVAEAHRTWS